jgi:hypothetical protein
MTLPCSLKKKTVGYFLVNVKQFVQVRWNGKYQMKTLDLRKVRRKLIYPLCLAYELAFGAMSVAARIICLLVVTALVASVQMTTQG